ncbi:growth hormone receptor isoform X2 [Hyla sarda]|nr:growth hormone receptor isoform X2 [Hyla sarda]
MEMFTCYWSYDGFNNRTDHVKLQYRTSDIHWRDCPDPTSGGDNSCFFNKEHVSVQSNYSVRLVSENSTSHVYHFTLKEIVEPDPPVALSWSLQYIDGNNSLLDIHVTWEPPKLSAIMLLLEYEVQIKEATEEQWKSYDVVTTTYLPVYGLEVGKKYLLRIHCRLHGNEKFGEFSEELVIPVFVSGFKPKDLNGWPSITQCHSQQLETFTCHWTYGNFENLSGSLKLQYMIPGMNWTDCPDTVSDGENSCYFSEEHTSIWVGYLVRLVIGNITFDEYSFTVSDIVDTTAIPRSSSAVQNRGPLLKDLKKTYPSGRPSITLCRSPQQETFACYWTHGNFRNLSGSLKLQYMKPGMNWTDCPDTVSNGENSCYFSKEHTSIWVGYLVRLVSGNITFDEYPFTVDEIVVPDPPISLNWTLLNVSTTRLRMDIELTWKPPSSADVKSGWMTLEYEIQLKVVNETEWKVYEMVTTTYSPIYGMKIGKEYMLRVRCRQKGNENFGEFSEVLVVPTVVNVEPDVPWPLFIVIGIFAVLMILAFILFCKKKRLKLLILPPVPVPKIKGIDPILLQKGKLDEVSSILASHDSYKQQLCSEDPWVEFIELDLDDQEEKNEGTDTDRLLGEEYPKASSCLAVKDDDSGRASCCEPDIPETDFGNSDMSDETSDTGQCQNTKNNQADLLCLSEKSNSGGVPTKTQMPNTEMMSTKPENCKVCPLLGNESSVPATTHLKSIGSKPSMDFYALVSDITPAGRLLLSPGQRVKMENEECNEPAIQQSPNLNVDNSYVCDTAVMPFCAVNFPVEASQSVQQNPTLDSYFTPESLTAATMSSHAMEKALSYETPVADYTSVHIINSPQNLVLNTTAPPGKEFPQPCGYMSTDQVNKVMP